MGTRIPHRGPGRGLVREGGQLILPLNKCILLIGLLRQYHILLDFQHGANKLHEELNHDSIPKACKTRNEKTTLREQQGRVTVLRLAAPRPFPCLGC